MAAEENLGKEFKQMAKINVHEEKITFEKEYLRQDIVREVMLKDKTFANRMVNASPDTKGFLNTVFKDEKSRIDLQEDNIKAMFGKKIL